MSEYWTYIYQVNTNMTLNDSSAGCVKNFINLCQFCIYSLFLLPENQFLWVKIQIFSAVSTTNKIQEIKNLKT